MAAKVGRDDVRSRTEPLGDLVPREREVEEAVDENERRVAGTVPLEDVVREPGREGDAPRLQGPASIWYTAPLVVVMNSSPRASAWIEAGLAGHEPAGGVSSVAVNVPPSKRPRCSSRAT